MTYRSPFITETNEPAFTDCQTCAGLMLVAEWTAGEAILDRRGNTLDAMGLKRLRERIRSLSGTESGASFEDLARGIARRFADLPALPRTTAPGEPLRLSFDELWAGLQAGHCAALDGNPSRVTDPRSPLRSMQGKDDYDHAVFIHAAKGERAFVMDPLGLGRYHGQWVPKADLRQFASRFTTPTGSPYCAVVERGEQSCVERLRREHRERTRSLRTELAVARAAVTTARVQALRDAARAISAVPRRLAKRTVEAHVARHGWTCPGWHHPPHPSARRARGRPSRAARPRWRTATGSAGRPLRELQRPEGSQSATALRRGTHIGATSAREGKPVVRAARCRHRVGTTGRPPAFEDLNVCG